MTFDDTTVRLALLAVATGVLAGALGSWVVLRRQAFLAHASGATAFAGASVAVTASLPVLPVALAASALVAALTGRLAARRPEAAQVATGLALACGLAIGVIATRSGAPQTGTSVLIDAVDLPAPVAGDIVATPTTGAYTFSMANTYNGTPRAPVV
ncbi:MAG: metal ABC transporter permease, partial [Solirubrobacteraceae bacterium]|nr:metal ABC transporter permease [Solirubrobacteraceae bacterium]